MSPFNPQNRGGRPGGHQRDVQAPVPKAIEVKYFVDSEKKNINPTLLDTDAEKQAGELHKTINSAQIRRFFGEIKNLYLRLQQGRPWPELEPFVRMVKSKALYAQGTNRIPGEFCSFLTTNIDKVKDEKDFKAFVLYFEAVLGFAYGKGMVKNENRYH